MVASPMANPIGLEAKAMKALIGDEKRYRDPPAFLYPGQHWWAASSTPVSYPDSILRHADHPISSQTPPYLRPH